MRQTGTICHRRRGSLSMLDPACERPQAQFDYPLACRCAAPPAALRPTVAPGFCVSLPTISSSRVGHVRSAIANCRYVADCAATLCPPRELLRRAPMRYASRFHGAASRRSPWPSPDQELAVAWSARPPFLYHPRTSVFTVRPHWRAASSRAARTAAFEWCRSRQVLTMSSTASWLGGLLEGPTGAILGSLAGLAGWRSLLGKPPAFQSLQR